MATLSELRKDFTRLMERDRLSHAYLLFGRARNAQIEFIHSLARFLETKSWAGEEPLVDAMIIDGFGTPFGIEIARSIQHFLYQTPVKSNRRFLAIACAEEFTLIAEQAILKIAEEPPEHALIVLTVPDPAVLLPALASRFQKLYLSGEPDPASAEASALAQKFFRADARSRRELLKELVEEDALVYDFAQAVMARLAKDVSANAAPLKELLRRITAMRQWNTNGRLQLEAALLNVRV